MQLPDKIIISRTDNLGDVILTLPLAAYLKSIKPSIKIYFIGKTYTEAIIRASPFVDEFLDREQIIANPTLLLATQATTIIFAFPDHILAKIAYKHIDIRIGTSHRWFHWLYCNQMVHFSRKNSDLHEAQLNCKLLKIFDLAIPSLETLKNLSVLQVNPEKYGYLKKYFQAQHQHFIIHPKSKGSAREWKIENYLEIAKNLHSLNVLVFVTGIAKEGELIREQCPEIFAQPNVIDLTGKLQLDELIALISFADGLLACSTGTLHIAAAVGVYALGLFPPMRPIHPQRWQALGKNTEYLTAKSTCSACKNTLPCYCMQEITAEQVFAKIQQQLLQK
jgi:heptosyltransferase-3